MSDKETENNIINRYIYTLVVEEMEECEIIRYEPLQPTSIEEDK